MVAGVELPAGCGRHRRAPPWVSRGTNRVGSPIAAGTVRWSVWMGCLSSASDPDTADHFVDTGWAVRPMGRDGNRATTCDCVTFVMLCHVFVHLR